MMPKPHHVGPMFEDEAPVVESPESTMKEPPPYLARQNYIPRQMGDFGDGGAFPEIHVSQYPLEMGRPNKKKLSSTAIVSVDVDANGEVKYDAIVKQGSNKDKHMYTSLADMKAKDGDDAKLRLPTEEEQMESQEKTRAAMEKIIGAKVAASKPITTVSINAAQSEAKFIKYTPNPNAPGFQQGAKQRIIRMVDAQVDPMEPAKNKHKKQPRGPPSPPVPVLHSPPRKVTVKDQQAWKIPPCISNWKNARGYTIPLDKRLAADGRGLQEQTINNNFATLSSALFIAERKARDEVEFRVNIKQRLAVKEKEQKEAELRQIAAQSRMARAGLQVEMPKAQTDMPASSRDNNSHAPSQRGLDDESVAMTQREKARVDRRREREREMRLDNMKGEFKRAKHERERDRDISEKIALGLHSGARQLSGEQQFDQRLFNQSAGMDSGFGADDGYGVYNKPLFDRGEASAVYRPKRDDAEMYGDGDSQYDKLAQSTKRFKADKGFAGSDAAKGGESRDGPVAFQRQEDSMDPYGLDQYISDQKEKGKQSRR